MGKFYITNNSKYSERLNNLYNECGFVENWEYSSGEYFFKAYDKLNIHVKNFYNDSNGFIIGTGTYIYNKINGEIALKEIYNSFKCGMSIGELQYRILGAYSIIIKHKETIVIFVDGKSLYDVHYHIDNDGIIVTNTHFHTAYAIDNITVNESNFIEENFLYAHILGKGTMWNEIFRMEEDTHLEIDLKTGEMKECAHEIFKPKMECESSPKEIANDVKEKYKELSNIVKKCALFLTGGSDSRMTLSVLHSLGISPETYYCSGDSFVTSSRPIDKNISKKLSNKLNLNFSEINIENIDLSDEEYVKNVKKYGEYFSVWGGNPCLWEFLDTIQADFFETGQLYEVYNGRESFKRKCFDIDYYLNPCNPDWGFVADNGYIKHSKAAEKALKSARSRWIEFLVKNKIDPQNITGNDTALLEHERYKKTGRFWINILNLYCYSFPLMFQRFILDKLEMVPFKHRVGYKFKSKLTREFWNDAFCIPLFSHTQLYSYDYVTGVFSNKKSNIKKLKSWIYQRIPHQMMDFSRKVYYLLNHDMKGLNDVKVDGKRKKQLLNAMTDIILSEENSYKYMSYTKLFKLRMCNILLNVARSNK